MFSSFLSILANFRVENLSDQVKCCEKGSRGKTQIRKKSVAKKGQCCEKGVIHKSRIENFEYGKGSLSGYS